MKELIIKEVNYFKEEVKIKYEEGTSKKTLSEEEPPRDELIEILKNLNAVGSRLLKYPFSIKDRIVVTGAKFIYKNNCLKYVILQGFYKLDNELIAQKFPKRLYDTTGKLGIFNYKDDDIILINRLLDEARKYIYGERKQVLLPHINETINTQPAKQNISMIN